MGGLPHGDGAGRVLVGTAVTEGTIDGTHDSTSGRVSKAAGDLFVRG